MISSIESVGITVSDIERSLKFYINVLSCKKLSDCKVEFDQLSGLANVRLRLVKLKLGNEMIELTEFLTPKGRLTPTDSRSNDCWFQHMAIVVGDMEQAYQHLIYHNVVQTSPCPQTFPEWNPIAGGIQAFYFKDPDGHNLELIHFPSGKGDPKWQGRTELSASLFWGIDHTAIVVASTDASLAIYSDRFGMKLHQQSRNYGIEQEHLSGISGVQVQISSLKAAAGLGIELLEYIKPNDGRPIPTDTSVNDIWVCYTRVVVENAIAKRPIQAIQAVEFSSIFSEDILPLELLREELCKEEFNQDFLIQDPDGHSIRLISR